MTGIFFKGWQKAGTDLLVGQILFRTGSELPIGPEKMFQVEHLWALGTEGMQCGAHERTYGFQFFGGLCSCCGLHKTRKG